MGAKGIRIADNSQSHLPIGLYDLLREVEGGSNLHWLIAFFYATGDLADGTSTTELELQINESEAGLSLTWSELLLFSQKYVGLRDITILGSKNKESLRRYAENVEMYEACDLTIEKVESTQWELFAKDEALIQKLATIFPQTEFLEPDFLKEEQSE